MKKIIHTDNAPKAIGPYSQAVEANGFVFVSGQIPVDPASGNIVPGGVAEQTRQVLQNIETILQSAGYSMNDVVKTTCLLSDMKNFGAMNEVYATFFKEDAPARAAFQVVELPKGVMVEIEAIAAK